MSDLKREAEEAKQWVLYEKDPSTKIATITLNRPERKNAPTTAMLRRPTPPRQH
jgi:enoyl-CoA hydratase/carnithine racemase